MRLTIVVFSISLVAAFANAAEVREIFRPAPAATVAAFRDIAQLLTSDDGTGQPFLERHRSMRQFAELDFDRGTAALVLGSMRLSPELVSAVESLRAGTRPASEIHALLASLDPALVEARKSAYRGAEGIPAVRSVVADWAKRYPPHDDEVEAGGQFAASLAERVEQLNALRRFYGLDVQLTYIQFLAQAHSIRRAKEAVLLEDAAASAEDAWQAVGGRPASEALAASDATLAGEAPSPARLGLRPASFQTSSTDETGERLVDAPASSPFSEATVAGIPGVLRSLPTGEALFLAVTPDRPSIVRLRRFDGSRVLSEIDLDADSMAREPGLREQARQMLAQIRLIGSSAEARRVASALASAIGESSAVRSLLPAILLLLMLAAFFGWIAFNAQTWVDGANWELLRDLKDSLRP